jgi:SPP1 family predicted phage head-tail adaptor
MGNFVNIGDLNQRITFNKVVNVKDEYGAYKRVNQPIYSCWASVRIQYLKEVMSTIGTELQDTITFIIRHQNKYEITNDMTITHDGKTYRIIQINPDIQNYRFDTIIAKAVS